MHAKPVPAHTNSMAAPTAVVQGLVSAIIPVFNRPRMLEDAVSSVLNQTYPHFEIIIVDDGSTDDTQRIANELAAAHPSRIVALHQPNAGVGIARENGRSQARGEFMQYLDSDDLLLPTKFELQVAALRRNPDADVSYGKTLYREAGQSSAERAWKRTGERIDTMFPAFLQSRWWGTSTPLYRRTLTDRVGPWLALTNEEDWEYDCRAASFGTRLCHVDEFLSIQREHAGPRLSRSGSSDPVKLRSRAQAHSAIYRHAVTAGLAPSSNEMKLFARELFLLARQCGAAGLTNESSELFALARKASEPKRARALDFKVYKLASQFLGWTTVGRMACALDKAFRP